MQMEEKLEKISERLGSLEHQYDSDKKVVKVGAAVFIVLLVAFFGISLKEIGKKIAEETDKTVTAEVKEKAKNDMAEIERLRKEADTLVKEMRSVLGTMPSGLRVLKIEENSWVYGPIETANKSYAQVIPCWNSYKHGNSGYTGTLELGYLVLKDKLHFCMMGDSNDNLRVEIFDINDLDNTKSLVGHQTKSRPDWANFEHKEIDTKELSGRVVKIRAIDKGQGEGDWIAISDFYVE